MGALDQARSFCVVEGQGMTRIIPFTAASLARAIKGVEQAGRFVVGVKPDGTLIVADKPIDAASISPSNEQPSPAGPRFGEKLGGQSAPQRA